MSYQWTVNAPKPALYRFDNARVAQTSLSFDAPAANASVQVSLLVSNPAGTHSVSMSFAHRPATASAWVDLGGLTPVLRTLTAGDKISVRAVLKDGRDQYLPATPLNITTSNAAASAWPQALMQAVNAQAGSVRISVLNGNTVTPAPSATAIAFTQ